MFGCFSCCFSPSPLINNQWPGKNYSTINGTDQKVKLVQPQMKSAEAQQHFSNGMRFRKYYNYSSAADAFQKAVGAGHPSAALEAKYDAGMVFKKNNKFREAFAVLKLAAEGSKGPQIDGHALSQCELGWFYWTGRGAQKNREEAKKWFEYAKNNGDDVASDLLKAITSDVGRMEYGDDQMALATDMDLENLPEPETLRMMKETLEAVNAM